MKTLTSVSDLPYSKALNAALMMRGIKDVAAAEAFLNPSYELADPFLYKKMRPAAEKILDFIRSGQKITVYGDYDVDGLSGSALLLDALKQLEANAEVYIPSRHTEGYGLNSKALAELHKSGTKLVISVDCGVTAVQEIKDANNLGLSMIVTDHHALADELPEAIILHPEVESDYPYKHFSGSGMAFTLARALLNDRDKEKWLLDLAALGTMADIVPLTGENRIIAKFGLIVLKKSRRLGLRSLYSLAGLDPSKINEHAAGFIIGPRLNASGRLKHAQEAIDLLTTEDQAAAMRLAQELERMNIERRQITARMYEAAISFAERMGERRAYVIASSEFNHGVAGIVAARVAEELDRPVLICETRADGHKGSARAPHGFNLIEGLRSASECFAALGGHAGAAGFTIAPDKLSELDSRLDTIFGARAESPEVPAAKLEVKDVTLEAAEELLRLAPFGYENEEPVFVFEGLAKSIKKVGADGSHLKFTLDGVDVIGFNLARFDVNEGDKLQVFGHIDVNEFNGKRTVQIKASTINR